MCKIDTKAENLHKFPTIYLVAVGCIEGSECEEYPSLRECGGSLAIAAPDLVYVDDDVLRCNHQCIADYVATFRGVKGIHDHTEFRKWTIECSINEADFGRAEVEWMCDGVKYRMFTDKHAAFEYIRKTYNVSMVECIGA